MRFSVSSAEAIRLMKWKLSAVPTYSGASASGYGRAAPGDLAQASSAACPGSAGTSPRAMLSPSRWSPVACSSVVCAATQNVHWLASETPSATTSLPVLGAAPASSDSRSVTQVAASTSSAGDRVRNTAMRAMPKSSASWAYTCAVRPVASLAGMGVT